MKIITDNTLSQQNPTIPVRWCVEREELVFLKNANAENIHVLLVVRYVNGKEDRQLIPWQQVMTYVSFRWPGEHMLYAKLVWTDAKHLQNMKNYFLEKASKSKYETSLFTWDDNVCIFRSDVSIWNGWNRCGPLPQAPQTELKISVPKEYFAKEPPEWLKWWTNLWFSYPPVDECSFRRRLILAFTLKPLVIGISLLFRTLACIIVYVTLLFFGLRGIDFSVIIHPWRKSIKNVDSNFGESWFTTDSKGRSRKRRIFIHPVFLAVYYLMVKLIYKFHRQIWIFLSNKYFLIVFGAIALIVALIFFLRWAISRIGGAKMEARLKKRQKEKDEARAREEWLRKPDVQEQLRLERERKLNAAFQIVGCATAPATASIKTLPPANRTFYLRYMDFKAKLCRPFAG